MRVSTSRRGTAVVSIVGSIAAVGALLTSGAGVAASTAAPIHGALAAFAIPGADAPAQLFAGTDGRVWFVNSASQLGRVQAGTATLTGVTLPSGNSGGFRPTPATIAAAGPEGVWSYASTTSNQGPDSCSVTLVKPGDSVMNVQLPSSLSDFFCTSGAADGSGSLWLGMFRGRFGTSCNCRVSQLIQVTTSGQVTLYPPVRPGIREVAVVHGADGAIWALEGNSPAQDLGRYVSGASPTAVELNTDEWSDLLARPDGSFWLLRAQGCSGLRPSGFCPAVAISHADAALPTKFVYPVSDPNIQFLPLRSSMAVGPDGSLWAAGAESSGPNRLFRMDANGQIDRSAGLTATGGTALQATGPITVTPDGVVWAAASGGGGSYLVRYRVA